MDADDLVQYYIELSQREDDAADRMSVAAVRAAHARELGELAASQEGDRGRETTRLDAAASSARATAERCQLAASRHRRQADAHFEAAFALISRR